MLRTELGFSSRASCTLTHWTTSLAPVAIIFKCTVWWYCPVAIAMPPSPPSSLEPVQLPKLKLPPSIPSYLFSSPTTGSQHPTFCPYELEFSSPLTVHSQTCYNFCDCGLELEEYPQGSPMLDENVSELASFWTVRCLTPSWSICNTTLNSENCGRGGREAAWVTGQELLLLDTDP